MEPTDHTPYSNQHKLPLEQIKEHHRKTGCPGDVKEYGDNDDNPRGAFCSSCKEEWLIRDLNKNTAPDCDLIPVAHHYIPTFCCLQVSDTGYFVRWKDLETLKPGDHVAWLRFISYWHHAIVEEVTEEEIRVNEWGPQQIHRQKRKKTDLVGNCCYSPMYKVVYPEEIEEQNPPDLVLLRATARLETKGYSVFLDNCEHFATFCKTGSHKCNQIFQYKVSARTWIARLFVALFHIAVAVSFAESIELFYPYINIEWLGVTVLTIFECCCFLLVVWITYKVDTRRENYTRKQPPQCTKAFTRAVIKTMFQSMIIVCCVAFFSIYFKRLVEYLLGPWSRSMRIGVEVGLGIFGGVVGNMLASFLIYYVPYPCFRNDISKDRNTHDTTGDDINNNESVSGVDNGLSEEQLEDENSPEIHTNRAYQHDASPQIFEGNTTLALEEVITTEDIDGYLGDESSEPISEDEYCLEDRETKTENLSQSSHLSTESAHLKTEREAKHDSPSDSQHQLPKFHKGEDLTSQSDVTLESEGDLALDLRISNMDCSNEQITTTQPESLYVFEVSTGLNDDETDQLDIGQSENQGGSFKFHDKSGISQQGLRFCNELELHNDTEV